MNEKIAEIHLRVRYYKDGVEDITKLKEALKEGMKGSKATIKEDW
jgi:hypothetical protein